MTVCCLGGRVIFLYPLMIIRVGHCLPGLERLCTQLILAQSAPGYKKTTLCGIGSTYLRMNFRKKHIAPSVPVAAYADLNFSSGKKGCCTASAMEREAVLSMNRDVLAGNIYACFNIGSIDDHCINLAARLIMQAKK